MHDILLNRTQMTNLAPLLQSIISDILLSNLLPDIFFANETCKIEENHKNTALKEKEHCIKSTDMNNALTYT